MFQSHPKVIFVSIVLALLIGAVMASHVNGQDINITTPPSISMDTFKARRLALMDSLQEGVAILYSQGRYRETGYRADGDFWYLTGINESGAILMLCPGERYREVLYLPSRDPASERWVGWLPDVTDSLKRAWGFDDIRRSGKPDWRFMEAVNHSPTLHLISQPAYPDDEIPPDKEFYGKVSARIPGVSTKNSSHFLESMRMIKSPEEIAAVETAIAITYYGITQVLGKMKPGITEYQLEAVLETAFKEKGAQHMAFGAIIGSGENSHFLHYQRRDDSLRAGQLMLMDVGAKWDRYSADITRTVPVDGIFTEEQAEIYDLVLDAQNAAIAAIKPGATYYDVDEAAREVFRKSGYIDDYWHSTGHHLGLNTHDPADHGKPLAPGMIITVEPGLYLPDLQFGIRIEDDVLVTENGYRILSSDIPRTREDVETWIAGAKE
jgi:Xaa-Pro aminopeptidase